MGFKFTNLLSIATGYAYIFFYLKIYKTSLYINKTCQNITGNIQKIEKKSSDLNVK